MQDKVIRGGMVAVLVSPGFGAGWSSWASAEYKKWALFSPSVVAWVEGGKKEPIDSLVVRELGDPAYFYTGGAKDLEIEWVPEGTPFIVDEYDGSESLKIHGGMDWIVA